MLLRRFRLWNRKFRNNIRRLNRRVFNLFGLQVFDFALLEVDVGYLFDRDNPISIDLTIFLINRFFAKNIILWFQLQLEFLHLGFFRGRLDLPKAELFPLGYVADWAEVREGVSVDRIQLLLIDKLVQNLLILIKHVVNFLTVEAPLDFENRRLKIDFDVFYWVAFDVADELVVISAAVEVPLFKIFIDLNMNWWHDRKGF